MAYDIATFVDVATSQGCSRPRQSKKEHKIVNHRIYINVAKYFYRAKRPPVFIDQRFQIHSYGNIYSRSPAENVEAVGGGISSANMLYILGDLDLTPSFLAAPLPCTKQCYFTGAGIQVRAHNGP